MNDPRAVSLTVYPRLAAIQAALQPAGSDLLALAVTDNLRYALSGFAPTADERFCALLIGPDKAAFVVPALNAAQVRASVNLPLYTYDDAAGPQGALDAALLSVDAARARAALADERMWADQLLTLQESLPAVRFGRAGIVIAPLRSRKDSSEIEALLSVADTADAGVEAVLAALAPGISEQELAAVAAEGMRRAGAEAVEFATVASGPNTAMPHHHAGPRLLERGDVVLIDIGSRMDGYCSDITRMAIVGGADPDPEYAKVHEIVEDALRAAIAAARTGVPARAMDDAARGVIVAAGYGEYFVHRTGHGLGISVHEPPYLTASSDTILESGMVFSIEPGIYLPGRFGVRLEEVVHLDSAGAHVFSGLPRAVHRPTS